MNSGGIDWLDVGLAVVGLFVGGGFSLVLVKVVRHEKQDPGYKYPDPDVASLEYYRRARARKYDTMNRMRRVARDRRNRP